MANSTLLLSIFQSRYIKDYFWCIRLVNLNLKICYYIYLNGDVFERKDNTGKVCLLPYTVLSNGLYTVLIQHENVLERFRSSRITYAPRLSQDNAVHQSSKVLFATSQDVAATINKGHTWLFIKLISHDVL